MIAKKTPWRIFASQIKSIVGGDYRMIFLGYKPCKKNGFSRILNFGPFLFNQSEMRINGWETHLKPEKLQMFGGDRLYQETGYNSRGCPFLKRFAKWNFHQMKNDPRRYERNLCNCVRSLKKFRTSTGFEPVTSRYWCDALTN